MRTIIDQIVAADSAEKAEQFLSSFKVTVPTAEYNAGERGLLELAKFWKIYLPQEERKRNGSKEKGSLNRTIVHACRDCE